MNMHERPTLIDDPIPINK